MADYYPLLARALDGLPDRTRSSRASVYERARTALASQLRTVEPALGQTEIDRELASLDEAIARAELRFAEAHDAPEPPAAPVSARVDDGDRTPAIKRGGRRGRSLLTAVALVAVITPIAVAAWFLRDRPASAPQPEPARPAATPARPAATPAPGPAPGSDPKFPERVGGGGSPRPTSPAAPSAPPVPSGPARPQSDAPGAPAPVATPAAPQPPAAPAPAGPAGTPAPVQPDLPVAQRAALVEENTGDPQQPKVTAGRALWRLDAINGGQGQPLETAVRATVEIPEAGISLTLVLQRNRDRTLPASHTMDLTFTTPADPGRIVRDVNPPLLRLDDGARGVALAGLSVQVKENRFLIGLSDLRSDVERNTDLLVNRTWLELPLRFASGQRATLIFEKGVSGERMMADAFKAWAQP